MKLHKATKHKIRFPCNHCTKVFRTIYDLRSHLIINHPNEPDQITSFDQSLNHQKQEFVLRSAETTGESQDDQLIEENQVQGPSQRLLGSMKIT